MAIRVALNHKTAYDYHRLVTLQPHVVRLRPAPHCRTPILSYSLRVQPDNHFLNWHQDPYSNYNARLVFNGPARELVVEVDLIVEMTVINPFDFFIEPYAEQHPFTYEPLVAKELIPYLETLPAGPKLKALIAELRRDKVRTIDYLVEINQRLQRAVKYVIRMEPGVQTCEETLTLGTGSCRDSAWLMVQVLRRLGLAARFVSGYLIQLAGDVKALDGAPSGPEHDFTDLHAWTEVYAPGAGWIGLDATSGLLVGEGHIPLACAADPTSASPISGAFTWDRDPALGDDDQCNETFGHHMSVTRIHEDPRVTKSYTDEAWQAVNALGRRIDDALQAGDVRLTMGGEPTFLSIDDRDGDEWTFLALGAGKRKLAGVLLRRLRERFAPGGLLHFGEGKWYPGESLPRWALGCYWRRDGNPVWQNPALVADDERDYGFGASEARRFAADLAGRLGIGPEFLVPGYEDIWYYMWREQQLPINVDPLKNRLDEAEERGRLAKVFEQGLAQVVGYALPLRTGREGEPRWVSGKWSLRREHLYLVPGDSPMGLRLPLDSLPWTAKEDREPVLELDPMVPRGPLPAWTGRLRGPLLPAVAADVRGAPSLAGQLRGAPPSVNGQAASATVRTSLCVEARQGRLHVFLPPQRFLEDYLHLVSAVEDTAAELGLPVLVEGYTPPQDHRLSFFKLTPDPGVIEANIQPAHDWEELVDNTTILYEEARRARLCTENFMIDGRHTGTGGGNHVVLGGPTPADSPILRRPDLLRSLLGYWHNHPSLSYLFCGMFVGPTSQAPRVDEARNDSLYELELAFRQLPEAGDHTPWTADRVFRHLLIDVTGNTHRAEFCIDKLYAPDASGDRLGLLELRGFEMPPDARMSLVQQLLVRGLVARFWKTPYVERLARWGTDLHDRFMLPHFIQVDFQDVLAEMRQAGFAFEDAWFAPHFEFRFPAFGAITQRGVHLELRQALEPWHVLGEEQGPGRTARYVDSSVERLQVKVNGLTDGRHVIACNGRRVPLHPTGVNGEFVAGVRYRAWQPPSCLHPNIPVHAPLVFDLVDTWMRRSLGGCTYHVTHPGGRASDIRPINANEAEGRRTARFWAFGHTPGVSTIPPEVGSPECPLTLDLRQPTASSGASDRPATARDGILATDAAAGPLTLTCAANAPPRS